MSPDKRTTLHDAVAELVHEGDTVVVDVDSNGQFTFQKAEAARTVAA